MNCTWLLCFRNSNSKANQKLRDFLSPFFFAHKPGKRNNPEKAANRPSLLSKLLCLVLICPGLFGSFLPTLKREILNQDIFKINLAETKLSIFYPMVYIGFFVILCFNVFQSLDCYTKGNNAIQWNTKESKLNKE